MTETTAPESARVDPRYYVDGATWERDIARRNRNSRALAWIVAAVMTVVAVGALGTVALLVPLKTYEPYMVVVDKTTGFVEVKRPMAEGPLTQDEAGHDLQCRAIHQGARDLRPEGVEGQLRPRPAAGDGGCPRVN